MWIPEKEKARRCADALRMLGVREDILPCATRATLYQVLEAEKAKRNVLRRCVCRSLEEVRNTEGVCRRG
jgi:hypothetical protein